MQGEERFIEGYCPGFSGALIHVYILSRVHDICDRACKNQPCEHKLHRVIFSAISSALNVVSHFCKFQKKAH